VVTLRQCLLPREGYYTVGGARYLQVAVKSDSTLSDKLHAQLFHGSLGGLMRGPSLPSCSQVQLGQAISQGVFPHPARLLADSSQQRHDRTENIPIGLFLNSRTSLQAGLTD